MNIHEPHMVQATFDLFKYTHGHVLVHMEAWLKNLMTNFYINQNINNTCLQNDYSKSVRDSYAILTCVFP